MEAYRKIENWLKELGFDNHADIMVSAHQTADNNSVALWTRLNISYPQSPGENDTVFVIFFVKDANTYEKAHISMVAASYHLHGQTANEALFEKIYSSSTEGLPTKMQIIEQMKGIMNGRQMNQKLISTKNNGNINKRRKKLNSIKIISLESDLTKVY